MAEPANTPVPEGASLFEERPTEFVVRDAWVLGAAPLVLAGVLGVAGYTVAGAVCLGLVGFVIFFFRNPLREIPDGEETAVAPADGRVIAVDEVEIGTGAKHLRVGIFLSVFNVHVNRAPLAGRVVSVERGGSKYLAAFNPRAETENARLSMELENAAGERFHVVQITGLVARRIVCHPRVGDWLARGMRYGLIRFGSRTDVVLPPGFVPLVSKGERVRGGATALARREAVQASREEPEGASE